MRVTARGPNDVIGQDVGDLEHRFKQLPLLNIDGDVLRGSELSILNKFLWAVTLTVALVAGTTATASADDGSRYAYVAVIDAGSSGTRLTLHRDQATLVPLEVFGAKNATRGLSSFASRPTQAGPEAITPLLQELDEYLATQSIPRAVVPVALLATAGMRNVQRDDSAAAQAILDSTAASIAASGHPLADNKILPAVQEATLAWLDANVIGGTLEKKAGSIGIIEVGGASAQVAFRSPVDRGSAVQQVRIAGRVIPVVAVSYLGLGSNDARTLMQQANDAGSFCFPNNATEVSPETYLSKSVRPVASRTAKYSWTRCSNAYSKTITIVGAVSSEAAAVPPMALRELPGFRSARFVSLGALVPSSYSELGILTAPKAKTALRAATTDVCTGDNAWTKVLARFEGRPITFADTLCANATYSYALLFSASGVGVGARNFTPDTSSFSRPPSWTSGYAITVLDP